MDNKLYVGNLPFQTGDEELQELFSQAGTVRSAQVIKDRSSGRSKGFAFVEMGSGNEARNAINLFNGKPLGGRPLTVDMARPRTATRNSGFGRRENLPGDGTTDPPEP